MPVRRLAEIVSAVPLAAFVSAAPLAAFVSAAPLAGLALLGGCEKPEIHARDVPPPAIPGPLWPSVDNQPVLPDGFSVEPVAANLVDPRAIAFDAGGRALVVEGEAARLSRVEFSGRLAPVAEAGGNGPWTGVAYAAGMLVVAEAGDDGHAGRLLRVSEQGGLTPFGPDLPAGASGPVAAAPDGAVLVALGSGRVAAPCQDERQEGGRVVKGRVPCTGSVLRVDRAGGQEVYAWGFRAPQGLDVTPDGRVVVVDDAAPTQALVWAVTPGVWYGTPQLAAAEAEPVAGMPNPPPPPLAAIDQGEARAVAVSRGNPAFGGPGQMFVAVDNGTGAGRIAFMAPGGAPVPFAANLRHPVALAFAPDGGALYVADAGTGRLWRIAPWPR